MSLAKDLLEGERDTVLEFFAECRKFWRQHYDKLDAWTTNVRGSGIPDFIEILRSARYPPAPPFGSLV